MCFAYSKDLNVLYAVLVGNATPTLAWSTRPERTAQSVEAECGASQGTG